ncbi:PTS sugar transporter subunit IIC [Anaerococcus cruorum]|uniref:PTS sugar transporter subunit IIC n=1 Tax=Anaerococcus cruorum TaxID=3115617 RepID=A0ABW9MVN5_9FIRM
MDKSIKPKNFLMNVLNGTAQAIVIALIPNAVLAVILKLFPDSTFASEFLRIVQVFQFFTPLMTGFLVANNFGLTAMQQAAVGGASMIGSGAWKYVEATINGSTAPIFQLAGIGDLINTMITAALAVYLVLLIGDKFGSLNIILLPIVIGAGAGYLGFKLLPYVSKITFFIGQGINSFTNLQPFLMSLLICIAFSIIIISPISTVAITLAIGLDGMAAAAAGMGVATCAYFLTIATAKNKNNGKGVPIAIFLGAMKMMMPNFFANPIMALPIAISAAITSIPVSIFGIVNTPETGGFGQVGFVSPIASLEGPGMNVVLMLICWFVIPILVTFVVHYIFERFVKIYDESIFEFKN